MGLGRKNQVLRRPWRPRRRQPRHHHRHGGRHRGARPSPGRDRAAEHATSVWHLSDGKAGAEGGWASGPQPDSRNEFGYLQNPEPLGGPGSAPAPDPKLYATYDGALGEPSVPAIGTETGLAGKIKDALT